MSFYGWFAAIWVFLVVLVIAAVVIIEVARAGSC